MNDKETISLKHYIDQRMNDILDKIDFIQKSEMRATDKALHSINERLGVMNEFRAQMGDQQRTYLPRSELTVIMEGVRLRLDQIEERMTSLSGQKTGFSQGMGAIVLIAGLISTLIILISRALGAC